MYRHLSLEISRNLNQILIILKGLVSHTIASLNVPSHHVPPSFIKTGLQIMMPGTSLKFEHQLQGSSCLSSADNLLFRTQIFFLIFSHQCLLVTAHLIATAADQFKRSVTLPRWESICVMCLLNSSEEAHL